jgi:hypothetical protein
MTDQEKAFEAEWSKRSYLISPAMKEFARDWYQRGLKHEHRERPKAKPLVTYDEAKTSYPKLSHDFFIERWVKENFIPEGTKIRVTVEEI